jgi:predicted DCC family thiol-disulfide oxidoreductase YuxK
LLACLRLRGLVRWRAMPQPYAYRTDPRVPPFPDDRPIIIFDGHCVLCSGFARTVLRRDKRGLFRLLPAQSPLGEALYRHYGLPTGDYETNILLEDGDAWFKSEGSIRMMRRLGLPWSLAVVFLAVPGPIRDAAYRLVASNRLRWFGRREVCYLGEPGLEDRFLS